MADKRLIFGIGTGRCGSVSLSTLLDRQASSNVSHEKWLMPWECDYQLLNEHLSNITTGAGNSVVVGDVGSYYLPYVQEIIEQFPNTKFVCMKRDIRLCIDIMMVKHGRLNMFQDDDSPPNSWRPMNPTFPNSFTKRQAAAAYYDMYYKTAAELQSLYPDNLAIFDTECLNTEAGVASILKFCGYADPDIIVGLKANQGTGGK